MPGTALRPWGIGARESHYERGGILAARMDHKDRKITQILGRRRMEPWLSAQV
jgi:hypothetical protein